MAEVATIYVINGPFPGTKTSLTNKVARLHTADLAEPGLNNPCKIPPTGFYYSFRMTNCLGITGDFNQVRDIHIHGDENFANDWGLDKVNGGALLVGKRNSGDNGLPIDMVLHGANEYAQATGTVGTTGHSIDDPANGHPYYKNQSPGVVDFDTCTADNPLLIDTGPYTDDFYSKAWVLSLKIPPTAAYGAKSPKSIIATYNIF